MTADEWRGLLGKQIIDLSNQISSPAWEGVYTMSPDDAFEILRRLREREARVEIQSWEEFEQRHFGADAQHRIERDMQRELRIMFPCFEESADLEIVCR